MMMSFPGLRFAAALILALALASCDPAPGPRGSFRASARSVELNLWTGADTGFVGPIRILRLEGDFRFSIDGRIFDAKGKKLTGSRIAVRNAATIMAKEILVDQVTVRLRPEGVVLSNAGRPGRLTMRGPVYVDAPTVDVFVDGVSRPIAGPVTVEQDVLGRVEIDVRRARWLDPPSKLTFKSTKRNLISWAGLGIVTSGGSRSATPRFGGVLGSNLEVTVRRQGDLYGLSGKGNIAQIFNDGLPTNRARVRMRVTPLWRKPVHQGDRPHFELEWKNLSRHDVCVLKMTPLTPAARWMNIALLHLPAMFGGEKHDRIGGVTEGFPKSNPNDPFGGKAQPLSAIVAPEDSSFRDISFDVPPDARPGTHEIAFLVEGNFDAVRLSITVKVLPRKESLPDITNI